MSAYALIIGLPHELDAPAVVVSGPEVAYSAQRAKFKAEFMATRTHKKFRQVQLLDSRRGVRKRQSFITPEEEKRRAKAFARENCAAGTPEKEPEAPPQEPETPPEES